MNNFRKITRYSLASTAIGMAIMLSGGITPATAQNAPAGRAAAAELPELDRAQIDALLATPGQVTFIDLRRADEVAAIGSLPVFLNIPLSELDRFLPYVPTDKPVVTISNHANRARRGAAVLAEHGFQIAGVIGVQDYQTQGGTLAGIAVDAEGRVYVATRAGIEVFSNAGAPLGVIELPKQPQNLAFAGADRSALYAVGRGSVFRIPTLTRGVDRPGK